jgi:eukaryotic-like serine/threonine-protein kinase
MNWGRYVQLEFIAAGGFANVYKAFDSWTSRAVAIKQLRDCTPDSLSRSERERDLLTIHLANPHVVDILDSCLSCPQPYLVLEYSSLGSLQPYVTKRRDWRRIAGWLRDISYGLTMVHERGDLVRDVKPSNLLRFQRADGSELIKIADFGLGQRPDDPRRQMTTSVFGTKGYIDPAAKASQTFSAASDIYSLGISMRELLTGVRGTWMWVPGPPKFRSLIVSMTDPNIGRRPMAREILERVDNILATAPLPAVLKSPDNPLGALIAGAVVVGGLLVLARAK